jgi:intein/homing endonuclease
MTTMERNKFYMKMKDNELAYIAGLFDGEGSIHIKRAPEKKKKHKGNQVIEYLILCVLVWKLQ